MKKIKMLSVLLVGVASLLLGSCAVEEKGLNDNPGQKPVQPGSGQPSLPADFSTGGFWHNFEGCGLQIWADSFDMDFDTGVLNIRTSNDGWNWWGGAVGCYTPDGSALIDGAGYDLSNVEYVTFDFNASAEVSTLYYLVGDPIGTKDNEDNKTIMTNIPAGKQTITVPKEKINTSSKSQILFQLGGSGDDNGTNIAICNFAFWDENDEEVILTLIQE